MKKIIFAGLLCTICFGLSACGSENKETVLSDLESGLKLLESREYLTYEYTIEIKEEAASGKVKYLVEKSIPAGEWTCRMYVDESLVSESRHENDMTYRNVEGEWIADEDGIEPPFVYDIIPEKSQIEGAYINSENDVVEIELRMNNDALQARKADIVQAGNQAVESLEKIDATETTVNAQRVQNEKNNDINFTGETRYYIIDENGVLISYKQILDYTRNGEEEQAEISFIAN